MATDPRRAVGMRTWFPAMLHDHSGSRLRPTLVTVVAIAGLVAAAATISGDPGGPSLRTAGAAASDATGTDPLPIRPTSPLVVTASAPTVPAAAPSTDPAGPPAATAAPELAPAAPAPPVTNPTSPAIVARTVPTQTAPPLVLTSPWSSRSANTVGGLTTTDIGCAEGTDAVSLDGFLAARLGPVLGADYQHVYPLGGKRSLWLFQDAFVDYSGLATRLDQASFVHNIALLQDGACFSLVHHGSINRPTSFEPGIGERPASRWFWPMGGTVTPAGLQVFWVEMAADAHQPGPGEGLAWHPAATWLATYDPVTLARTGFQPAADSGTRPIYGYAVESDGTSTYLFGNTFEQNLEREGGFANGPHSATQMFLARVPLGQLDATPEYRSATGWTPDPAAAVPVSSRYWVENPMQPRYLDGQWVATTKVDGYWGEDLSVDVANQPWGPWTTVQRTALSNRGGDPLMNTYHAIVLPWRATDGSLEVVVSQNARDMTRDAFPDPARYRPEVFSVHWATAPPDPAPPTSPPPTDAPTTSAAPTTTGPPPTVTAAAATTSTPAPPSTTAAATTTAAPTTVPRPATTTTIATGAGSSPSTAPSTVVVTTSTVARPPGTGSVPVGVNVGPPTTAPAGSGADSQPPAAGSGPPESG